MAVAAARGRAVSADTAGCATFCVGDMTAAGVGTGVAEAVVCIETIMFAGAHLDALRECRRILAPGGRLVLTGGRRSSDRVPAGTSPPGPGTV